MQHSFKKIAIFKLTSFKEVILTNLQKLLFKVFSAAIFCYTNLVVNLIAAAQSKYDIPFCSKNGKKSWIAISDKN
jgi:hypothetical protein